MRSTDAAAMAALLILSACAGKPSRPGPPPPQAGGERVKIGQPYQVFGVWYYPKDEADYDVTGIASWYGPGFHGLSTANGEAYEMDGLSAAHKTLPLPSYVEVTNIENGRKLVVRINDRGPFVAGRIIDLSRRAAQLLGIDRAGTAKVRVRRIVPDAATFAALAPAKRPPVQLAAAPVAMPAPVVEAAAAPVVAPASPPMVASVDVPASAVAVPANGTIFIQVAALSDQGKAEWLAGYLRPWGPTMTQRTGTGLWRVRIGPFASADAARAQLLAVQAAGYGDARLVSGAPPS